MNGRVYINSKIEKEMRPQVLVAALMLRGLCNLICNGDFEAYPTPKGVNGGELYGVEASNTSCWYE